MPSDVEIKPREPAWGQKILEQQIRKFGSCESELLNTKQTRMEKRIQETRWQLNQKKNLGLT